MGQDCLRGLASQFASPMQLSHRRTEHASGGSDALILPDESTVVQETQSMLITHIRVAHIFTKLRRIPVGFHVAVKSENGTQRTSNKPALVGKDDVEWDDEIILPSNLSSTISLTVLASFELGPTLGAGEILRELEINVGELFDRCSEFEVIKLLEQDDGDVEIKIRTVAGQNECAAAYNPTAAEETRRIQELTDMGHVALIRYRELQEQRDLDESIKYLDQARDLCPPNHSSHATVLFNLANAKLMHCRVNDVSPNLAAPIDLYRAALSLRPRDHPDHSFTLLSLGIALKARFRRQTNETDEGESDTLLSQLLDISQPDSYVYHAALLALNSTANTELLPRVENPQTAENVDDDDEKVDRLDVTLQRIFCPNTSGPVFLDPLGILFCVQFNWVCRLIGFEKAITMLEVVIQHTSDDHPNKPSRLDNLACSLSLRYERFGDVVDMEKLLSISEALVQLTPDGHPYKLIRVHNLASSLSRRHERFGDVADLEKSLSMREDVVQLTPEGDLHKPLRLNALANSLASRYEHSGDVVDLEKSISIREDILKLTPDGHPYKPQWLINLATSLSNRYARFGDVVDLKKSISIGEVAARLVPDGHPDKPEQLNSLAISLTSRYERFGDTVDLEKSKPLWLDHLATSLLNRYERFGDVVDLEKSLSVREDAVRLTPDGHLHKPHPLNNLAISFFKRYKRFGDITDLEKSLSITEDVVQLTPEGHPHKLQRLISLAETLRCRYEHFGDVADLEKSLSITEDVALQLTPDGHPDKPLWLNVLANSLLNRYQRFGDVADLEKSISIGENAVQLMPDSHPDKLHRLDDLATSLYSRYEHCRDVVDLEKSISIGEDAIRLTPDGHPSRPLRLNNLAMSLASRYARFGDVADLEKSISFAENAVHLTPDGHTNKSLWLNNLTDLIVRRYWQARTGNLSMSSSEADSELRLAMLYSSQATQSYAGRPSERFRGSLLWIWCLRFLPHESQSLLDAYTISVGLLPQMAWIGLSFQDRYHQLLGAVNLACDAAAAALGLHRPNLAVEWLEQGRSIMWSQLSQLRTPVDDLRSAHPVLAAQFEHVSHELENAGIRNRNEISGLTNHSNTTDGSLEQQARQYHTLALSREVLLADIRALPGFERFLLPKTIDQLSSLTHSGHVVLLSVSTHTNTCDALVIVAASKQVLHVPLSHTNYDEIVIMWYQLSTVLRNNGRVILRDETDRDRGARLVRLGPTGNDVFKSILSDLWNKVVSPILDVLDLTMSPSKHSRIFWCPTGPFTFLPIHAAGLYDVANRGPKLSDYVISSYIPTMSALEQLPQRNSVADSGRVCLLAVPQPTTDGQRRLHGVKEEMGTMRELASSSPFMDFQEVDGTVEDALMKMNESDWVHFCCHGTQDRTDPLDSGLLLADGKRLKLSDIVGLSRPRGGLAFLSACQTAMGDETLSDEAIHLAAGMLLVGYSGVIATMWSIMDSDAPRVTRDVYGSLFGNGNIPDSRGAAEALHHAIEGLRDSGAPFLSWVPFVHYGL